MRLPINTFLTRLHEHLEQFDEDVYPPFIEQELLQYIESTKMVGELAGNLDKDSKKYLEEVWKGNLQKTRASIVSRLE